MKTETPYSFLHKERGFLTLKTLLMLLVLGFFLMCGFKIGPAYLDNRFVEAALKSAGDNEPPLHKMSIREARNKIDKLLAMNNVRGKPSEMVEIEPDKDRIYVNIDYDVRMNMFYNLDVIISFKNQLDSARPDLCCTPTKTFEEKGKK